MPTWIGWDRNLDRFVEGYEIALIAEHPQSFRENEAYPNATYLPHVDRVHPEVGDIVAIRAEHARPQFVRVYKVVAKKPGPESKERRSGGWEDQTGSCWAQLMDRDG